MMSQNKSNFEVSLEELLEAGAHFGHQSRRWNPKMKPFIYATRDGVHIFDLVKTAEALATACEFVKDLVAQGGNVIFLGTKRQAQAIIKEEAEKCGTFYINERWLGGTITNWEQISKSVRKLEDTKARKEAGEYKMYTKKENVLIDREINRLDRFLGGLVGLKKLPEAIFVVDVVRELAAVKEANARGVSVVAMVDSNGDPDRVAHVIPVNDDAVRSIKLVVTKMAEAVSEGKRLAEKKTTKEQKPKKK